VNSSNPTFHRLTIALGERSYPIVIGAGLFDQAATYAGLPGAQTALIVTNTTIAALWRSTQNLANFKPDF
jgi:3-dehydroquinate synthase